MTASRIASAREFEAFDRANPHIWAQFVALAEDRQSLGFEHFSARAILHQMRWRSGRAASGSSFKIDNNTSAYYARKYHRTYPEKGGFFRMREMKQKPTMAPVSAMREMPL